MSQSLLRVHQHQLQQHQSQHIQQLIPIDQEETDSSYSKNHVNTGRMLVKTNLNAQKSKKSLQINREEIVMKNLLKFYSFTSNLEQLLNILQKQSKISLRILDWFVTNYAKEYCVVYNITKYGRSKQFNVYQSYKAQLKAYHKKLFDPFCRHRRIFFEYSEDSEIETTVGQLNFFQWAISYKVLDYVEKHLERITGHMSIKNKERSELNSNASNSESFQDEYTEPLPEHPQQPKELRDQIINSQLPKSQSQAQGLTIRATASQEGDDTVVQIGFGESN